MFNGGMGNMQGMMKKVQKLQADMAKMQEELKLRTIETTVGGGAVTVVVSGKKEVVSVKIDPSAVDPEDVEMLEDLLVAAVNEGMRKIDEMTEAEMGKLTGGMKMPGMIRPLANVHEQLRRLPGIGSKTALRLAYHIIDMPEEEVRRLAETLLEAKRQIRLCDICYNLTDAETCEVCGNAGRDHSVVCVVEQPQDVMAMERSRGYNGVYHVLHGVLSPLDGIGPDNLRVKELLRRLQGDTVREVIIATNSDVEGEATAAYLAQLLKPVGIVISRIAHGLPVGGDLEYADELTLSRALENRHRM